MEITPPNTQQNDPLDKMASQVGDNLSRAETNALKAYSLEETDKAGISKLAKELGMKDADTVSLDGLRLFAKRALDKAQNVYETIANLFNVKKRTQEVVINNIGR